MLTFQRSRCGWQRERASRLATAKEVMAEHTAGMDDRADDRGGTRIATSSLLCSHFLLELVEDDAVVEFAITGEEFWARMERAVEKVNERLRKTVRILEHAKVPYAVIGGHAVRAWVAQVDEAALRTTQDVDILSAPSDLGA